MPLDGSTYETEETRWLMEGRENLLRWGWCQNAAQGLGGTVCMLAALPIWGRSFEPMARAERILLAAIEALGYPRATSAAGWQDASGRTIDEVLAVYSRAIVISRGEP